MNVAGVNTSKGIGSSIPYLVTRLMNECNIFLFSTKLEIQCLCFWQKCSYSIRYYVHVKPITFTAEPTVITELPSLELNKFSKPFRNLIFLYLLYMASRYEQADITCVERRLESTILGPALFSYVGYKSFTNSYYSILCSVLNGKNILSGMFQL